MSDNVFFGSHDKKLYAVNAASGTKVWEFATGGYVQSSPTVADGLVFVGSYDKKLYAVNVMAQAQQYKMQLAAAKAQKNRSSFCCIQ